MIDSQLLVSGFVFGLSMGSIFFLMTIGLSLCFGVMRVISLDQLLYYTVGAYIAYTVSLAIGNLWIGVLGGIVVGGLAALAVERLVFRRIYEREIAFSMITSFGILIGGVGVVKYFWGLVPRPVAIPIEAMFRIERVLWPAPSRTTSRPAPSVQRSTPSTRNTRPSLVRISFTLELSSSSAFRISSYDMGFILTGPTEQFNVPLEEGASRLPKKGFECGWERGWTKFPCYKSSHVAVTSGFLPFMTTVRIPVKQVRSG